MKIDQQKRFQHLMDWLLKAQIEAEVSTGRDRKYWLEVCGTIVRMMAYAPRMNRVITVMPANSNGATEGAAASASH